MPAKVVPPQMPLPVFSPTYRDFSALTGFSGNALERLSEKRTASSVADAMSDTGARLMLVGEGRLLLSETGEEGVGSAWFSADNAATLGADLSAAILLGLAADGTPRLAAPVAADPEALPDGYRFPDFRSVYVAGLIDDDDLGALAQAGALLAWHRTHRFCARCGGENAIADGGVKRVCRSCAAQHFPRTDPVVIMLTIAPDNQRVLLGRSPHFPAGMYSCLAGFVEAGETLENAVRRETFEEAGVRVGPVAYHASQPWPFPHSLMVGMHAVADSETIHLDDELEDARWFTRDEVAAALRGDEDTPFQMPPKGAIAWRLVEAWIDS